jgi:hypothetical protein
MMPTASSVNPNISIPNLYSRVAPGSSGWPFATTLWLQARQSVLVRESFGKVVIVGIVSKLPEELTVFGMHSKSPVHVTDGLVRGKILH